MLHIPKISSRYNRHRCCPKFSKTSGYSLQADIVGVGVVIVVSSAGVPHCLECCWYHRPGTAEIPPFTLSTVRSSKWQTKSTSSSSLSSCALPMRYTNQNDDSNCDLTETILTILSMRTRVSHKI